MDIHTKVKQHTKVGTSNLSLCSKGDILMTDSTPNQHESKGYSPTSNAAGNAAYSIDFSCTVIHYTRWVNILINIFALTDKPFDYK